MADTDIELTVGFDTKDVRQKSKELRDSFRKTFDSTDVSKMDAKQRQLLATMSKVGRESEKVEKEMAKLAEQKMPTAPYAAAERKLHKLESQAYKVGEAMSKLEDKGETSSKEYSKLVAQSEDLTQQIEKVNAEMENLVNTGKAFTMGDATQKFADLENKQANLTNQMTVLKVKAKEAGIEVGNIGEQSSKGIQKLIDQLLKLRFNVEQPKNAIDTLKMTWNGVPSLMYASLTGINKVAHAIGSGLVKAVSGAASAMARFAQFAGKAVWNGIKAGISRIIEGFKTLKQHIAGSRKSSNGLGLSFKTVLKYGLGIRSLYVLFNKLRGAITDSIKVISQMNGGNNELNKNLSTITSSLTQLKNAFGAAFVPIVNVVIPILDSLIQKLVQVSEAIAMLMAKLTGQSTFIRAKKVQQDFADSISKTGKSAEKASKALGKYDELAVIGSDSGSGANASSFFEEVPVEETKLSKALEDFFKPFQEAWNNYGQPVIDAWEKALFAVKQLFNDIYHTFMDIWTNGTGTTVLEDLLILAADLAKWIESIANAFDHAWNEGERGAALLQGFFDMIHEILRLIHDIAEDAREVWDAEFGENLFADILEILTNIENTVKNITANFREAWNENDRGKGILESISEIILIISGGINDITKSIADWSATLDFGPLLESVQGFLDKAQPIIQGLQDTLTWLFTDILEPLGKWALEGAVPAVLDWFGTLFDLFAAIGEKVKPNVEWLWNNLFQPLAEWTGGAVIDIMNGITEAVQGLADLISGEISFEDFVNLGVNLVEGLLEGIVQACVGIWQWLKTNLVDPIWTACCDLFETGSPSKLFEKLGKWLIEGLIKGISDMVKKVKESLKGIKDAIVKRWDKIKDSIEKKTSKIKEKVVEHWDTIKEKTESAFTKVKEKTDEIWGNIKKNTAEKAKDVKEKAVGAFSKIKTKIVDKMTSLKEEVGKIWDGIKQVVKTPINDILGFIEKFLNGIVSAVNKIVEFLNKLSVEIPDWIPEEFGGGQKIGFNLEPLQNVSLPRLAQGAVIPPNKEFAAILGDQKSGTNIETPLDTMIDAFRTVMEEFMGSSQGSAPIVLQLNGKQIAKAVWDEDAKRYKQSGTSAYGY